MDKSIKPFVKSAVDDIGIEICRGSVVTLFLYTGNLGD